MQRKISWIIGVAIASIGVAQFDVSRIDQTTTESYVSSSGDRVDVIGVCKLSDSEVSCWDAKGKLDAKLSDQLAKQLASATNSNANVTLRFGKKNRTVIVCTVVKNNNRLRVDTNRKNQNHGGYYNFTQGTQDLPQSVDVRYDLMNLSFEPDATTTFVDVIESNPSGSMVTFAPVVDAKVSLGDRTATIQSIKKEELQQQQFIGQPRTAQWQIRLVFDNPLKQNYTFTATALDKDSKAIQYVNDKGRPLNEKEIKDMLAQRNAQMGNGFYLPPVQPYLYLEPGGQAATVRMSIDPVYVKQISVSATSNKTIRIEGIPLDPKP